MTDQERIAEIREQCEAAIVLADELHTERLSYPEYLTLRNGLDDVNDLLAQLAESEKRAHDARNELCLKCGRYHEAHKGACDGCRWRAADE
ncbi:hypothetical protein SDC9_197104 [bioreactor metagenome]|uniref:Uncharacterized protein n=1 Tax=bioreactor metagenome TaxID=1076179 RepID=A0A645IQE7_9ZZZZ